MNCNPPEVVSWYDWAYTNPDDPLDLIANAEIVMGGITDKGVFVNSSTYTTPPAQPNLLKIYGVRIIDPTGPTILASLLNPISTLTVGAANNPKRIEIDFTATPDSGTVNISSFFAMRLTTGLIGSTVISFPVSNTARLDFSAALPADVYMIQLNGTSSPVITLSTIAMDGEALALPSGDGVPGGDFLFGVNVVSGTQPIPPPAPPVAPFSTWNPSHIYVAGPPVCVALESTNAQKAADAAQWNFNHLTANTSSNLAPPLPNRLYLRGGTEWRMDIPLNLGNFRGFMGGYPELVISLLTNAATRGDCQGTVPAILFNSRVYTGAVTLRVTLKKFGNFMIGIRGIDPYGYYSMYNSTWYVVK